MAESIARRVHELLNQAMDVEKGQRSEFLRQACQESPELASRVEQLVSAVDDSLPFLEIPALQVFAKEIANGEEPLPQFVGNYEIVKKIGTGGMGSVYEALQQQPRRTVALKIPRKRRWKQDLRQQLRFESELLGRLRHAHIAQVYEAGVDDSQAENPIPFFAMEFVPAARNIRQYVKDQQLDVGDILLLMRRICDAIQHAHRLGIIHRDLKPANILVDSDGNPKVIDFGVASSHAVLEPTFTHASEHDSDTPSRSSSGGEDVSTPIAGTLNYMSPEQCDATCTVDARADVYSLGVILFELLCQSLPYDLKGMSIAEALQTIPTVTLRPALRHGRPLPGDLRAILNRVLEKDRNGRYSSAEALSEDIQRYLESRPVLARKANLLYTGRLAISRNRWLASILGLLVFAILTGLFFSTLFAWRASAEVERRRLAEAQALQQLDQALWQSYVANMLGAYAAFQNREIAMVRSRLSAAPEKHRDWEWDFLSGMVDINEQVIDAHDVMITSFAASDDRSLWATGSQDGIVRVWNSQDGSMVCEIVHNNKSRIRPDSRPPVVTALAFRNGSSQIVSGTGDGAIRI